VCNFNNNVTIVRAQSKYKPCTQVGLNDCAVTSHTNTEVQCVLPEGQGTQRAVSLTVGGQQSVFELEFNYNPPVIVSISPSMARTIGGELITLTGSSFGVNGMSACACTVCAGESGMHAVGNYMMQWRMTCTQK